MPRHLLAAVTLLSLLFLTQCKTPGVIPGWGHGAKPLGADSYGIESSSPWGATPPVSRPPRALRPTTPSTYPLDGTVTESPTGNRTYRDPSTGQILGSESTSPAGITTSRDSAGRILGNASTSPAGVTTYRTASGAIDTTSATTSGTGGDATTTYRRDGAIVGTKYVSPAGNVTWRDGSGRIIEGPSAMQP